MVRNPVNHLFGSMLLALALLGAQNANAEGKKMMLTRPFKAGVSTTYKATVKASVQGMDIVIEQSSKQTIKSVKDNGTIVILSEDLGGVMTLNGMEQEQKPGMATTETRDKLGKLTDYVHEEQTNVFAPEIQKLMSATGELISTDKEVEQGDSWDTLLDNPASKDNKVKVKTTYQGIDKVDGVDLWKFKQTTEAVVNVDGSKMTSEATVWINPKDGLMEKTEGKVKDVPTQVGPIDISMTIRRVKAAAGDAKPAK